MVGLQFVRWSGRAAHACLFDTGGNVLGDHVPPSYVAEVLDLGSAITDRGYNSLRPQPLCEECLFQCM
ncbi:MAG: hypothetical protein WCH86_08035 [Kiritimatiellales bacterium]